jgi:2-octaprenyl-6-methoxyphenol hydroxylase
MPQLEVLVRGAGPAGCTAALALHLFGVRVALLDRPAPRRPSFRPIALSHASRLILERVGAWQGLRPTPIESVHVSQQGGFGRVQLDARDAGVPALGYVVDYGALVQALHAQLELSAIARVAEAQAARCTVHAEGSAPEASEKRYQQDAVVGLVSLASPARTSAFERFTPEGPLALLPCEGRYALVWSTRPERARALAEAPQAQFLAQLAWAAGTAIGSPAGIEARSVQPLALRVRPARVAERSVYIGNAAQTLHPVAGQGLNLGLRDAWDLAQALRGAADPGDAAVLARYASSRRFDAAAIIGITDLLAGAFTGSSRAMRAARGIALTALDVLPGPRRFFARRMIYGASALP